MPPNLPGRPGPPNDGAGRWTLLNQPEVGQRMAKRLDGACAVRQIRLRWRQHLADGRVSLGPRRHPRLRRWFEPQLVGLRLAIARHGDRDPCVGWWLVSIPQDRPKSIEHPEIDAKVRAELSQDVVDTLVLYA